MYIHNVLQAITSIGFQNIFIPRKEIPYPLLVVPMPPPPGPTTTSPLPVSRDWSVLDISSQQKHTRLATCLNKTSAGSLATTRNAHSTSTELDEFPQREPTSVNNTWIQEQGPSCRQRCSWGLLPISCPRDFSCSKVLRVQPPAYEFQGDITEPITVCEFRPHSS